MKEKVYYRDLLPPDGIIACSSDFTLKSGDYIHYNICTEFENMFAIFRHYNLDGGVDFYLATKKQFFNMIEDNPALENPAFKEYCQHIYEGSSYLDTEGYSALSEEIAAMRKDESTNSLQTQDEVNIAANKELIEQVQKMFESDCKKMDPSKWPRHYKDAEIEYKGKKVKRPMLESSYECIKGNLLESKTLWFYPDMGPYQKAMVVFYAHPVKINEYKRFMYNHVVKTSRVSFKLGLPLLDMGSGGAGKVASTVKEGATKACSKGKPIKDGSGNQVTFSLDMIKRYYSTTIEAEVKEASEFKMKALAIPIP